MPSTSTGLAPRATSSGSFSRSVTGPTCSPARARGRGRRAPRGRPSANDAAATASANSRKKPSLWSISRPPWRARRARALRSCSASTLARARVAQALDDGRAVHEVGEEKRVLGHAIASSTSGSRRQYASSDAPAWCRAGVTHLQAKRCRPAGRRPARAHAAIRKRLGPLPGHPPGPERSGWCGSAAPRPRIDT